MKTIRIILWYAILWNLMACSGSLDELNKTEELPLELIATSPQQNAVNLRAGTLNINFTFNQAITPVNLSLITINDKPVNHIEITTNSIQLTYSVNVNSSYTVYVGKGAIANIAGTINEESYALSFTTEELILNGRSIEATRLLNYLKEIEGEKTLSSATANVDWNYKEAMWINKHTGRYPAINNFDYGTATHSVPHPNSWMNYADITPVQEWAKSGGIVSAMWHWEQRRTVFDSPNDQPYTSRSDKTDFNPSAIFDPSSADYAKIITDIDEIANWMKPIAELGIPIIWRPMHEAQGNWTENNPDGAEWRKAWFWWGKDGPEALVELWRVMYDRMVNYHKLNNLIWVFTTGDSKLWYPGDEYVDIVGCDLYGNENNPPISPQKATEWYNFIKENYPGKLAALSECGRIETISKQWESGAKWTYFMPWYDWERTNNPASTAFEQTNHFYCNINWWNDTFKSSHVVTRDQLPCIY